VTELALILLPAVLYVRLKRLPMAEALRWRPIAPGLAVRAVILGCTGWGAATVVELATNAVLEPVLGPSPLSGFFRQMVPHTPGGFALFFVLMALLPGICEETLFRGALQGTLERKGPWKAVLITAALFALLHVNPWGFLPLLGVGLFLGAMALRAGSTLAAMIAHACNNALSLVVVFFFRDRPESDFAWLAVVVAALFALAFTEFIIYMRRIERAPSPLAAADARLPRPLKVVLIACAAALPVLLVAGVVGARAFVRGYRMTAASPSLGLNSGDVVIVLRNRWSGPSVKPGDVVAFRRDGRTLVRRVARVNDATVWVIDGTSDDGSPAEAAVPRADLLGRMVRKLSLGNAGQ
jgi:membrane protease YdiL (CAAX protease family)